jgi:hypothetical protein
LIASMRWLFILAAALLLLLAACNDTRASLGQAYVAPATLHLHSELVSRSATVAALKHGDHVLIVDVQRRMVRVRTDAGVEGWTDSSQLLSPEQMDGLKQRRQLDAALPPEGTATAYESLNVHLDPDRQSPSFAQIPEGGAVTILGYKVTPKSTNSARGLIVSRPKVLSRKQRKEQQARSYSLFHLPPKPAPPKPPANWQQLSAERIDAGPGVDNTKPDAATPKPKAEPAAKPTVLEDWTLVRTRNNEIGWVLSRNLMMSIPDEVAQYAEGKHITAFFDLGLVNDAVKGPKHNWLWTTAASALPYDFDSWRVFLWNARRHRYETSFRMRGLEGYFPVHVEPPDPGSLFRTFQLITQDDDGKMRRRSYTFDGHLVHLANTEAYNPATDSTSRTASAIDTKDLAAKVGKPAWFKREWAGLKHRIFGN